jgi:hypothetical protein
MAYTQNTHHFGNPFMPRGYARMMGVEGRYVYTLNGPAFDRLRPNG